MLQSMGTQRVGHDLVTEQNEEFLHSDRRSLDGVLVSQDCHSKLPPIMWLKTTDIHSLPVLEARGGKSRCEWNCTL